MKNLNENALMQEMNENEMANVNGGFWGLVLKYAAQAIVAYDIASDFKEGWDSVK